MGTLDSAFIRERLEKVTRIVDSVAKSMRGTLGSNVEDFKKAAIRSILDSGVNMDEAQETARVVALAWEDPDAEPIEEEEEEEEFEETAEESESEEVEEEESKSEEEPDSRSTLVLSRRDGESVVILLPDGEYISLFLQHQRRSAPKLIIKAPRHIPIWRGEVLQKASKEGGESE